MVNAQIWLNNNIPHNNRVNIQRLIIKRAESYEEWPSFQMLGNSQRVFILPLRNSLTGTLNLSNFTNLEELTIEKQLINFLILTNCCRLKRVDASNNLLQEVVWPQRAPYLKFIDLNNNNLWTQDLSSLAARFSLLEYLFLGTNDEERIRQNIYNRWSGSLYHIRDLSQLKELDINATDIDSGLEYLPTRELFHFTFGNCGRTGAGVDQLKTILEDRVRLDEGETMESWAYEGTCLTDVSFNNSVEKIKIIRSWQDEQQLQAQIQTNP